MPDILSGRRARPRSDRHGLKRALALVASVAWLGTGALFGVESFGIASFVHWRPVFFIVFLAVNSFAAGVVVSEFFVAAWPRWASRRVMVLQAVAAALLF